EIVQTAGLPSGSLFPIGTTVNTFEITDLANNTTTCSFSVTVIDETAPVAECGNFNLFLDNTGKAYLSPEIIEANTNGIYDPCGIASITVDKTEFTCSDLGRNTITLTVTDNNGNTSTCNPTVFVRDNFVPVISLVDDIEIEVPPGICETSIEYPDIAVSYNCFVNLELIEGLGKNGMFPLGTTTETWQATNAAGQASTLSFTVTVNTTNAPPAIDEIADVFADKDSTSVLVNLTGISRGIDCQAQELTVTAETDNNELVTMLTVIYTSEDSTGTLEAEIAPETYGTANITVTVEDSEGEMVTEIFALTVNPVNNVPFLVTPVADQTVNANRSLKIPLSSALGELFDDIDNDELTISVVEEGTEVLPVWATYQNDTLLCQPTIADTGCVNIVVTATDTSGATASDTFEICVDGYPVGTSDLAANRFGVKLYPNPTNGLVTVELSSGIHDTELSVMDIAGRIVLRKSYSASERLTFNMSGKVAGMYFVKMNIDGKQFIEKLIVKD
ncbi:MAG: T9SS type A sorting domain-containing protein, partial [Prolixibacteraceae bacterium]|nr:T9SS type A sorting domain-containing protein [Prolixibacteraceae bacterium]